jgi:hypothetical protein
MSKDLKRLIWDIENSFSTIDDNVERIFNYIDRLDENQELFNDTIYFNMEDTYNLVIQLRAFRDMVEEIL